METTLVLLKPDALHRCLENKITQRFLDKGLLLLNQKMLIATEPMLKAHYEDLIGKDYFPLIIDSMTRGPLIVQLWHGLNAVAVVRKLIGDTDPQVALPGTIRGDFAMHIGRNICHASDSLRSAEREIKIWFLGETIPDERLDQFIQLDTIYRFPLDK
jgi:nucleoside-diphosphate kinase